MSLSVQTLNEYPITPSEIILLSEDTPLDPSDSSLITMLAAAFVANEAAGSVRLEVHDRKLFFGVRTISELLVIPSEEAIEWPAPSFEAYIVPIAEQLSYLREYTVSKIVYNWMGFGGGWKSISKDVIEQLAARGLLEKREVEVKGWFFGSHYDGDGPYRLALPPSTLELVSQAPVSLIREMLSDFERTQPDLWLRITAEATEGIKKRQKER